MTAISLVAAGISKAYDRRPVFEEISFTLASPASLAVTGRNGAGKSTLSKILLGLVRPSTGTISYVVNGRSTGAEQFKHLAGFVSPYLNLYDEFSAIENLRFLARIRGRGDSSEEALRELLERVGLWHRRDDAVGTYSSGMKQRLKYAFALLHRPPLLILDEPTSNLDADGAKLVRRIAEEQKEHGILIVATNDANEAGWCAREIKVGRNDAAGDARQKRMTGRGR